MSLNLSPTQKRIVNHRDGALLVVAGPGSGKTRVLTERIRYLLENSQGHFRILALTFTNKAANEMKERLVGFPDIEKRTFIGTMHSYCMDVLESRGQSLGIHGIPAIFEQFLDRQQVLLQAVQEDPELNSIFQRQRDQKAKNSLLRRWMEMIGQAKNNLVYPEDVEDIIERKVYEAYNAGLRGCDALDFDDLLLLTYKLFTERPKIADFYRRQYKYILIDEAQDLNKAQYKLLGALCGSDYKNVMLVGDPKQAIYMWNGASPEYLDRFEKDYNADKIVLDENYRSSKAIIQAAKGLAKSYPVKGEIPIKGELKLIVGENEEDEAAQVFDYLNLLIVNGHPDIEGDVTLERCAILGRTRYALSYIEKLLEDEGLPFYKQFSSQDENESELMEDFKLCLKILTNPRDSLHLSRLLKRWNLNDSIKVRQLSNGTELLEEIGQSGEIDGEARAVLGAIKELDIAEGSLRFVPALDKLSDFVKNLSHSEDKAAIMRDIMSWRKQWDLFLRSQTAGHHRLSGFLSNMALGTMQQPRQEGIPLLTVHASKGLEFDVVVIMGMADGVFPDYRATGDALEEEKRNAFVAVTRSKRLLCVSFSKTKLMPWGDIWSQTPSAFLKNMGL